MKKSNFLLLVGSSIISISLLLIFYKLLPKKNGFTLTKYNLNSLNLAHNYVYSLEEIKKIRKSFAKPFVTTEIIFEEETTSGKYLNKHKDGYRISFDNSLCNEISSNNTVWILGGSTTYGYGVEDSQTIPSHLAKYLKNEGTNWCVLNFGRGYFYSTQELLYYTKLLANTKKIPKVVIFIDGLNEYFHLLGSSFLPNYSKNKFTGIFNIHNKIFHNRYSSRMFGSRIVPIRIHNTIPEECIKDSKSDEKKCDFIIQEATARMIRNWTTASKISSAYDITFLPVLQPVPLHNHYFINPFSNGIYKQHRFSGRAYDLMKKTNFEDTIKNLKLNYLDTSNIFSKENKSCKLPYVDPVHYSGCGNEIIGSSIAKKIFDLSKKN